MNFKKAVKKIKKLVRESENPFVEECVSVFESRGLDGGKLLEVNFTGVSEYKENFDYRVLLGDGLCYASEKDTGFVRYEYLKHILSLGSIDELIDIAVPRLDFVSFGRFTSIASSDILRESVSWSINPCCGQIHDLSATQVAKLAQRDIASLREKSGEVAKKWRQDVNELREQIKLRDDEIDELKAENSLFKSCLEENGWRFEEEEGGQP